jgi:hypothetical protein
VDILYVTVQSDKAPQAKKNFNRFSVFVKSGGESYILGTSKVHVPEGEKVYIMVRNISDYLGIYFCALSLSTIP